MKAGELHVKVEQENVLWYDRKRVTVFALPWSFTQYRLTESKIIVKKGILVSNEEEVKLYRITDVSFSQNLIGRLNNTGSVTILSDDASSPVLVLKSVKNPKEIKNAISQTVEGIRRNSGIRVSELI